MGSHVLYEAPIQSHLCQLCVATLEDGSFAGQRFNSGSLEGLVERGQDGGGRLDHLYPHIFQKVRVENGAIWDWRVLEGVGAEYGGGGDQGVRGEGGIEGGGGQFPTLLHKVSQLTGELNPSRPSSNDCEGQRGPLLLLGEAREVRPLETIHYGRPYPPSVVYLLEEVTVFPNPRNSKRVGSSPNGHDSVVVVHGEAVKEKQRGGGFRRAQEGDGT